MKLRDIVDSYIREYRDDARIEMRQFKAERSLSAVIRRAALCEWPDGTRHPHQRRIPKAVVERAEARLQAVSRKLARTADFAALHELINNEIGGINGVGALMVYDIAQRIGAYLEKAPRVVYLHRGTKHGAAILGFHGETLDPSLLPIAFAKLTAAEIEDCLCIYKEQLRGASDRSGLNSGCHVAGRQHRACV